MNKPTMRDVARRAGVSVATVSRVINNNYPTSSETKDKVQAAIRDLSFSVNYTARSLKSNKTDMIGVLVPDIANPYFMAMAKGIESVVSAKGYKLVLASSDEDPQKELDILHSFLETRLEMVFLATCADRGDAINQLIGNGLNIIVMDMPLENVNASVVIEDTENAIMAMIDYVVSQGHRDIAIVNGNLENLNGRTRFDAFLSAMRKHRLKLNPEYNLKGMFRREQAYKEVNRMLSNPGIAMPTALFSASNRMTEGVLIALFEKGLRIPEDISVASYGDISVPELVKPRLTILDDLSYEFGVKAGNMFLNSLQTRHGKKLPTRYVFQKELVIRDSVRKI